jgi:predicted N-acetyltransferase YhbS
MVGLAPVGALPEHQGRGIGTQLIREGLHACREAGYRAAVVLGEPGYYSRFGFEQASGKGLGNEYGVDEHFMVAEPDGRHSHSVALECGVPTPCVGEVPAYSLPPRIQYAQSPMSNHKM